jgi:6-phosphofructokinase 1
MIRTVAANSYDVRMCAQLAAAAVHGGMAGFTGFLVGHVNNALAMIPVETLFGKKGVVDIKGREWQRTLAGTGQPQFYEPNDLEGSI